MGHNHSTNIPFNIYLKAKWQRLSLEAQLPDLRGEPRKDSPSHPQAYIL